MTDGSLPVPRPLSAVHTPSSSHRAGRIALGLVAAGLLAWAAWWGYRHVLWWTPTGHEIARVVRGAADVDENVLTPPQARRNVRITAAEMAALARAAHRTLADYYTGPALDPWRAIARRTLDPHALHWGKTTDWMTWWRVDWVHLDELTLTSGGATATAVVQDSSNGGAVDQMRYTWQLRRTAAGWRIGHETFQFEPGSGP